MRSYRTISPLPRVCGAVSFLWHFPWDYSRFPLGTALPCRARTFLPPAGRTRHPKSGRLDGEELEPRDCELITPFLAYFADVCHLVAEENGVLQRSRYAISLILTEKTYNLIAESGCT